MAERIKVLQVAGLDHFFKYFLKKLVEGMAAEGWEVVCACGDSGYAPVLRADGMDLRAIPYSRTLNPHSHMPTITALARLMRREKFDVVHTHNPLMSLLVRSAAAVARPPLLVYTAHGFYFHEHMPAWKRLVGLNLERLASPFTDLLLTQNAEDAETAARLRLFSEDKIFVIGNGINIEAFDPGRVPEVQRQLLRQEFGIPEQHKIVGMVARFTRDKGLVEFLEAAAAIRACTREVSFLVVGGAVSGDRHPIQLQRMRALADFYGVGDRMVFTGVRDDIPAILSLMDVFVLPSYREGMPRTVLEAMAMEVPVVVTDIRGCREEVTEGVEGYFVPVKDAEKLADRVLALLFNGKAAREMGRHGRERVLRQFNEEEVVRLQIEIIRRLLEERRARRAGKA